MRGRRGNAIAIVFGLLLSGCTAGTVPPEQTATDTQKTTAATEGTSEPGGVESRAVLPNSPALRPLPSATPAPAPALTLPQTSVIPVAPSQSTVPATVSPFVSTYGFTLPPPCGGLQPGKSCWLSRKGVGTGDEANSYYRKIGAIRPNQLCCMDFVDGHSEGWYQGIGGDYLGIFRARNGFGQPGEVHATYFNNIDLRIGRDMHCKQNGARVACYVSNYGPPPFLNGAPNPAYPDPHTALIQAVQSANLPPIATVAMEYAPDPPPVTVTVHERDGDYSNKDNPGSCPFANTDGPPTRLNVDTGIDVEPGDVLEISATGKIWAGQCATGDNGPKGWDNITNESKYPLTGVPPYSLLGVLRPPLDYCKSGSCIPTYGAQLRGYFYIGEKVAYFHPNDSYPLSGASVMLTGQDQNLAVRPSERLMLRTNDDAPGNGTGSFQVTIKVHRQNVKFYAYDANGNLITNLALDREGPKFMPQMCLACHGGTYDTTTHRVSGASFLPFDVYNFLFQDQAGFRLADQQEKFRLLNQMVKATNPSPDNPNHSIGYLIDVLYAGYTDKPGAQAGLDIPGGWGDHRDLFQGFVRPFCRVCHTALSNPVLAFDSYNDFKTMSPVIAADLCQGGTMPHAQGPFDHLITDRFPIKVGTELQALGIGCIKVKP
jgi:hypothetical protein